MLAAGMNELSQSGRMSKELIHLAEGMNGGGYVCQPSADNAGHLIRAKVSLIAIGNLYLVACARLVAHAGVEAAEVKILRGAAMTFISVCRRHVESPLGIAVIVAHLLSTRKNCGRSSVSVLQLLLYKWV